MDSTIITPDDPTQSVPFPAPAAPAPPPAAANATAQHCANCGALLAADQRYCMECGERHGEPRLPVMTGRPDVAETVTTTTTAAAPRGLRPSANTGLIAGVGTLLIALGVGVVIGRSSEDGSQPSRAASGVQVVTVAGGGAPAAAGASTTAPAATADASAASSDAKGKSKSSSKGGDAKKDASDATSAVKSGGTVGKSKGKVVKVGQKGKGPGYKDGKFTGDFFGG